VEFPISLIHEKAEGDMNNVTAKIVIDSAKEGDAVALDIFNTYVDTLSSAITSVVSFLTRGRRAGRRSKPGWRLPV
jgi:glucokinase